MHNEISPGFPIVVIISDMSVSYCDDKNLPSFDSVFVVSTIAIDSSAPSPA